MRLWTVCRMCTWVGLVCVGMVESGMAQPNYITMHRGMVAHSLYNMGFTGKFDNHRKHGGSPFRYPPGRMMRVYSGGSEREGWNAKANGAGEGIWILSKVDGVSHVSAAGSEMVTPDIVALAHAPGSWKEAYAGVTHHEEYALATRQANGAEAHWTDGVNFPQARTNWWRGEGGMAPSIAPSAKDPVVIWNFRFNEYNSGISYANRIQAGEIQPSSAAFGVENLSDDDFPEVVGITRAQSTESGLTWTRKWHQWGHQEYDKFLINETIVENDSGELREGVYIVFQNRFWQSSSGAWREGYIAWSRPYDWSRDNHARSTMASNYLEGVSRQDFLAGQGKPAGLGLGKDLAAQGHAILYAHDGESSHFTNTILDVGDPYQYAHARVRYTTDQPWVNEGFLNHSQYFGVGVVDALPPFNTYGGLDQTLYAGPVDNPATDLDERVQQPASISVWRYVDKDNFTHPSPLFDGPDFIYDTITQAGYTAEPDEAFAYSQFMVFGPYDLLPGEKAKVVLAYVGGMGADAPKYDDYKRYGRPFNFEWLNLGDGVGNLPVKFSQRQQDIPLGEDAMFRHFQNAIDAYNWGYDIPNQPPSIKVSWEAAEGARTILKWSAWGEASPDPDYEGSEAQDLRGYRIYRSETENQGPWELVDEFSFQDVVEGRFSQSISYRPAEVFHTVPTNFAKGGGFDSDNSFLEGIPLTKNRYVSGLDHNAGLQIPGVYRFTDPKSKFFDQLWYSVRYYDSGHTDWKGTGRSISVLESAAGASGGTLIGNTWGVAPFPPGSAVFDRLDAKITLVPNIYKVGTDLHTNKRSKFIIFQNVPARAKIEIYDVSGQQVGEKFHDNVLEGVFVWNQGTFNGLTHMAPGIYFWKVTSLMPESMGKSQKGTFLIIK
jgi:hypothetical protein